uniref:Uncharacterized protein n=1 Tax=Arundo donax TaxID=35708 RepID=A0A0A9EPJ3_ARUDO
MSTEQGLNSEVPQQLDLEVLLHNTFLYQKRGTILIQKQRFQAVHRLERQI